MSEQTSVDELTSSRDTRLLFVLIALVCLVAAAALASRRTRGEEEIGVADVA